VNSGSPSRNVVLAIMAGLLVPALGLIGWLYRVPILQRFERGDVHNAADSAAATSTSAAGRLDVREERYSSGEIKARTGVCCYPNGVEIYHSTTTQWYKNGQVRLKGQFTYGVPVGEWEAWHENGKPWVHGRFSQRGPSGIWTYWDVNGESCGQRNDGMKVGHWKECCDAIQMNGEGLYLDGHLHGPWRFTDQKGEPVLDVEFDRGQVNGKVIVYKIGKIEYEFEHGQEQAELRQFEANGNHYGAKQDRFRDVLQKMTVPSLESFRWIPVNGPFDPPYLETTEDHWPDGKLKQRIEYRVMFDSTQAVRIQHGKAGSWYASGSPQEEQEFQDGLEHGKFSRWYANRQRQWEIEYRWGSPSGHWQFWHPNGQKQAEGMIDVAGRTHDWHFWNLDGSSLEVRDPQIWLRAQIQDKSNETHPYLVP
jgi:antitoxin component YwqK of YwqJK toxin-antitoxin module